MTAPEQAFSMPVSNEQELHHKSSPSAKSRHQERGPEGLGRSREARPAIAHCVFGELTSILNFLIEVRIIQVKISSNAERNETPPPKCRNQPSKGTWKTSDGWIEFQKEEVSLDSYRDAHFCIPCFLFPAPKCLAGSITPWCFTVHDSKASWTHWAHLWILPYPWSSDKESGLGILRFRSWRTPACSLILEVIYILLISVAFLKMGARISPLPMGS